MTVCESIERQGALLTAVQYVRALAVRAEASERIAIMGPDRADLLLLSDEIEGALRGGGGDDA